MKKDIHPQYNTAAKLTCTCGATFVAGSTRDDITIETCSQCHPFYTGKQKIVDSTGRVDRFKRLQKKTEATKAERETLKTKEEKNAERAAKKAEKAAETM